MVRSFSAVIVYMTAVGRECWNSSCSFAGFHSLTFTTRVLCQQMTPLMNHVGKLWLATKAHEYQLEMKKFVLFSTELPRTSKTFRVSNFFVIRFTLNSELFVVMMFSVFRRSNIFSIMFLGRFACYQRIFEQVRLIFEKVPHLVQSVTILQIDAF